MKQHACENVGCQSVNEVEYDLDGVVGELDGEGRDLGGVLRVENVVFVQRHQHENTLPQNVRLEENLHVVRSLLSSSRDKNTHVHAVYQKQKHLLLQNIAQLGKQTEDENGQVLTLGYGHRLERREVRHAVLPLDATVIELFQQHLERLDSHAIHATLRRTSLRSTS